MIAASSAAGAATALQPLDVAFQHPAALARFSHTIYQTVFRYVTVADADFTGHVGVELLAARLNDGYERHSGGQQSGRLRLLLS